MDEVIKNAIKQVRAELEEFQVSLSDAKAERKAIRQAINGTNTVTMVIESYHGFSWADEIGTVESQATSGKLAKREAWLDREIGRFKEVIKVRNASLSKYEIAEKVENA